MIQKKSKGLYALLRTKWMQQLRSHSNALSGCRELLYGDWGIQREGDDRHTPNPRHLQQRHGITLQCTDVAVPADALAGVCE